VTCRQVCSITVLSKSTLLAVLATIVAVFGLLMFVADELLVAGVSFLAVSLLIYAREKRL
jgi:hypothetical protein